MYFIPHTKGKFSAGFPAFTLVQAGQSVLIFACGEVFFGPDELKCCVIFMSHLDQSWIVEVTLF